MVLVAQSLVGREGLNLQQSCRTVVLFQPEWNPGVVEQQIGRVDRIGSLWEEMVTGFTAGQPGGIPPKIKILPVVFPGTYDEHNWHVLMRRWADYRAQMAGEVFAPPAPGAADLTELQREANHYAPDFSP